MVGRYVCSEASKPLYSATVEGETSVRICELEHVLCGCRDSDCNHKVVCVVQTVRVKSRPGDCQG